MLGSWNGPARLSHETASWFCECHILPCQIFFQNQTEFPFSCWPLLIRGMVVCLFPQGSHTLRKRVPTHKDLHDIFVISKCTQSFGKTRVANIICIGDRVIPSSAFFLASVVLSRLSSPQNTGFAFRFERYLHSRMWRVYGCNPAYSCSI